MRQLRQAVAHKRTLYGHTLTDARALFAAIDTDSSGVITPTELRDALERMSLGVSDDQLALIVAGMDTNENRQIEYVELLASSGLKEPADREGEAVVRAAQAKRRGEHNQASVYEMEAAERLHQQAALSTTIQQLQDAVANHRSLFGHTVTDVRSLFAAIDSDGSGEISREELRVGLKRLGIGTTELEMIVKTIDKDGDGTTSG